MKRVLLIVLSLFLSVALFAVLYRYDNKYQLRQHETDPLRFLISDWEFYRQKLLTPADFADIDNLPKPDEVVFIGKYAGFEGADPDAEPHGSATYRHVLDLPAERKQYTLELPEIFSSSKVYIDGALVQSLGETDPERYKPLTRVSTASFEASGSTEILIAATDYNHLYSGLTYPPAFGEPEAVTQLANLRLLLRSAALTTALFLGLVFLAIGVFTREKRRVLLYYGLMCILYIGYTSYPIIHNLTYTGVVIYRLESFCFAALLLMVMLIQGETYGMRRTVLLPAVSIGVTVCVLTLALPPFFTNNLPLMNGFSRMITAYKWSAAAFLTLTSVYAFKRNTYAAPLLAGLLSFDVSLVMDRVLPIYEPIYGGWFSEVSAFLLVIAFGVMMCLNIIGQYRENIVLGEHLRQTARMVEQQRSSHEFLTEQIAETQTARHDLRHHLALLQGMASEPSRLSEYLEGLLGADENRLRLTYCENYLVNVLLQHYAALAKENNVRFTAAVELSDSLGLPDADVTGLFANLLENAIEACAQITEGAFVDVTARQGRGSIGLRIENSCAEKPVVQKGLFQSRKRTGNVPGVGISSVRAIAARHNGTVEFSSGAEGSTFIASVWLFM